MLNWDEFHAEEKPVVRNNAAIAAAAQQTARPVEEEEPVAAAPARAEPDAGAAAVGQSAEREITAASESAPANDAVARARAAVNRMDAAEGVAELEGSAGRVQVDEKRMINCRADLNQLVPFKYDWAWQKYLDGCANHWMPQEINMSADVALWKNRSEESRVG